MRKLHNQVQDARGSCKLDSHANLEVDNKKLRAELDAIKVI
jgi:hypothetical protein